MKYRCNKCGKRFVEGNDASGLPNGVSFMTDAGKVITVCKDCVMVLGSMQTQEEKDEFLADLENRS